MFNQSERNVVVTYFNLSVIVAMVFVLSCSLSKNLKQSNAEKVIKELIASRTDEISKIQYNYQAPSFNVQEIMSIAPVRQFSENEASCDVIFKKHPQRHHDLALKFVFKRDINSKWFMTNVDEVEGFYDNTFHTSEIVERLKGLNMPCQ